MKLFVLSTIIWSILAYVKGRYFETPVLRNDTDYIVEGVWVLGVPIIGLMYGGLTVLAWKFGKWVKAKFVRKSV
jgi:hypothetical protein